MEEKVYHYSRFCGLLGYPIKHTLSPLMHNLSFEYHSMDWVYLPFEVKPEELERAVIGLKAAGAVGFNVTMPFKESVIKLLDEVDEDLLHLVHVHPELRNLSLHREVQSHSSGTHVRPKALERSLDNIFYSVLRQHKLLGMCNLQKLLNDSLKSSDFPE